MNLLDLGLRGIRFPDPAGDLQRAGATASLIRELGENYGRYHEFLALRLDRLGPRPDPASFATFDEFASAWGRLEAVVQAEVVLRRCRAFRLSGASLDAAVDPRVPLMRDDDSLASLEG
jgi:hypothetical protein